MGTHRRCFTLLELTRTSTLRFLLSHLPVLRCIKRSTPCQSQALADGGKGAYSLTEQERASTEHSSCYRQTASGPPPTGHPGGTLVCPRRGCCAQHYRRQRAPPPDAGDVRRHILLHCSRPGAERNKRCRRLRSTPRSKVRSGLLLKLLESDVIVRKFFSECFWKAPAPASSLSLLFSTSPLPQLCVISSVECRSN